MKKKIKWLSLSSVLLLILSFIVIPRVQASDWDDGVVFTPGTFEAEADGHNGSVKVAVTFDETSIVSIDVTEQNESKGLGDEAIDKLVKDIVSKQSLAVDVVTGASESSDALIKAVTDCIQQAGGNIIALQARRKDDEPLEAINKTADVIIVGAGGAGLAAAVSAAEENASVILIDKSVSIGGNTVRSGAGYNTYDPERQDKIEMNESLLTELKGFLEENPADYGDFSPAMETLQTQIQDYLDSGSTTLFDSPELHQIHMYLGGKREDLDGNVITPNYELAKTLTTNSLDTLHWLEDNGVEFSDSVSTILGALWPRSHGLIEHTGIGMVEPLANKAKELGVEIMTETKGKSLIQENGRVTGVVAETATGAPVNLTATKGVIITTGGFGANAQMRREVNNYWEDIPLDLGTTNTLAATGDGIIMAQEIGADVTGMEFIQLMPSGQPGTGSLSGGVWGSAESQVFVNKEGKRFVNEYAERDVLAKAALEQEDDLFYIICDSETSGISESGMNGWGDKVDDLVASGSVYKADTLEELAEQLEMDPAVLEETIETYNAAIDAGEDTDFGKTNFGPKIEVGPFYATPRSPSVHHTMGGLVIDSQTHVLDTDGKVIDGLFAAGEVTGGIHAGNRLGGNAITDIMTFGRIAGKTVTE